MDRLATVLALRAHVAHPPAGDTSDERFARDVETELARLGWLIDVPLRDAISVAPAPRRTAWADWLLATLDADVGGDRAWVPLYRRFPATTPEDTDRLYVDRLLAGLFQDDGSPCVLCGAEHSVHPVRPCGHLVCHACFVPGEQTACPICLRRIDPTDPYLTMPGPSFDAPSGPAVRLQLLRLGGGLELEAVALRDALATRLTPLDGDERADLDLLIGATTNPGDLSWLPAVASRETKAVVTAVALRDAPPETRDRTIEMVADLWETATDIARTLWTMAGGLPNLHVPRRVDRQGLPDEDWRPAWEPVQTVPIPRIAALRRVERRAVLAKLDGLPMPTVLEDVGRHPTVWKRIAERLHPFEFSARHPRASLVFSVLREASHHVDSAAGMAVVAGERAGWVRVIREDRSDGHYVSARGLTFRAALEQRLGKGDMPGALALLRDRPGDLLRRLDHLARKWPGDPASLVDAARHAATVASPRVAFAAAAALSGRDRVMARARLATAAATAGQPSAVDRLAPRRRVAVPSGSGAVDRAPRVYFPRGGAAFVWSEADQRDLLAPGLPTALRSAISQGLVRRAGALSSFDVAVIDTGLKDVPVPVGTQTGSGSSWSLPRGTMMRHPASDTLRLFLHWVDPVDVRVDLDLSVVLFDADWVRLDHCDYTHLRSTYGAVHSGDLTSAPGPLGATEFLDLDVSQLRAKGVQWLVPVVFSYNDVPFENLDAAIAGVGVPTPGRYFDPAGVLVRYDLVGDSRASVPFIANVADGSLRWVDQHLGSKGYAHSVGSRGDVLAHMAGDLEAVYSGSTRATLHDVAMVHATARAATVLAWDGEQLLEDKGAKISLSTLTGRRVLVVSVDEGPPVDVADGSVLVSVKRGREDRFRPIDDLLDEL